VVVIYIVEPISVFIHVLFRYDDYNYAEINKLIEAPLKQFIKTVSCHPRRTDRKLYDSFWKQFKHSEKVQLCIMIMEARLQVSLLYGMRAFTQAISLFWKKTLLLWRHVCTSFCLWKNNDLWTVLNDFKSCYRPFSLLCPSGSDAPSGGEV